DQAKERKNEILLTFTRMVEYANLNQVQIIMIAGDLFDTKNVSVKTRNVVMDCIVKNPGIDFLYLKGNHDTNNFLNSLEELPQNLKLFQNQWTAYRYDNLVITGTELNEENQDTIYDSLILNKQDVNIVMMHGQESQYSVKDKTEVIHISALRNKNIDYLALGHIHSYKESSLDNRGVYCYPGCLEGRGFDECGSKGFVLLEITQNQIERQFIPFAGRILYEIIVDITGMNTTNQVDLAIGTALSSLGKSSLVKIVLQGNIRVDSERNISYLTKKHGEGFYFLKISDQTKLKVNIEDFRYDASLKGEFIRLVMEQNYSEQEKKEIIETGLKALAGEELES
ncbi:MAG: DNA repair exonuclease, partial [Clostridiales bacterium]|nr:DNA repair exonuclease [Clostridiales bacterium]